MTGIIVWWMYEILVFFLTHTTLLLGPRLSHQKNGGRGNSHILPTPETFPMISNLITRLSNA